MIYEDTQPLIRIYVFKAVWIDTKDPEDPYSC